MLGVPQCCSFPNVQDTGYHLQEDFNNQKNRAKEKIRELATSGETTGTSE